MYKVGSGVYLEPSVFKFRSGVLGETQKEGDTVDADVYPEYYRKAASEGGTVEKPQPFCVGLIEEIKSSGEGSKGLMIKVRKFYRPENTHKSVLLSYQLDLNLLYWSEEGNHFKNSRFLI